MRFRHCPGCGAAIDVREVDGRERDTCSACSKIYYDNPIGAVAVVLLEGGRVLLALRNSSVFRGRWCIPGGFIEVGETPEESVQREAREELGIEAEVTGIAGVFPGYEIEDRPVLGVYYNNVRKRSGELQPGSDVSELRFFALDEIPDLPFDGDRKMIALLRAGLRAGLQREGA